MFVVLYTAKLCVLCIYDFFHILLSLWHTYGSMECMYVYMHVCLYSYVCLSFTRPALDAVGRFLVPHWRTSPISAAPICRLLTARSLLRDHVKVSQPKSELRAEICAGRKSTSAMICGCVLTAPLDLRCGLRVSYNVSVTVCCWEEMAGGWPKLRNEGLYYLYFVICTLLFVLYYLYSLQNTSGIIRVRRMEGWGM